MRVLDLFSGIGGFSLGLERAGFETVAFCEIEEFPRRVLAKHWPGVPIYDDVRTLTAERLAADGIAGIDVICGGFPCQDISTAGKQAGIGEGTRSGLWSEIVRLAGDLQPRFIIVENVANLLAGPSERPGGWFGRVLGDLAELGFDAEWENIPASALGAPHRRERVWLVAYANGAGHHRTEKSRICAAARREGPADHAGHGSRPADVADAQSARLEGRPFGRDVRSAFTGPWEGCGTIAADWRVEPGVGRVANGVPARAHRIKALGNAVVPQIPEMIGRAIMAAEASRLQEAA